jgi:ABC-type transport system involved in cytochrome c biogenesis permease subunit
MTISLAFETTALAALAGAVAVGLALVVRGLAGERQAAGATGTPSPGPLLADSSSGAAELPHRLIQVATVLLLGSMASLAVLAGRPPWAKLAETSIAFAAAVLVSYQLIDRQAGARGLALPASILAAVLVGYGLALPDEVQPLVPALQQPLLLTVHVGTAVASYGVGGVAFLAAVCEIAQRRAGDAIAVLPTAAQSRRAAQRAVIIAFPLLTAAIVLGAVWANLAWRSYWNNDPKELAAAATWLVYAAQLHVAGRRDRWGGAAPWLLIAGFGGVLFTWLGAGLLFVGQHGYATG